MRVSYLIAMLVALGCNSKQSAPEPGVQTSSTQPPASTRAPLVDLTTSLSPARTAFNAHKGELRFLALLSPT